MEIDLGPIPPSRGIDAEIWSRSICPAGEYASWWSVLIAVRDQRSFKTRIDKTVGTAPGAVRPQSGVANHSLTTLSLPSRPTHAGEVAALLLGPRIQVDLGYLVVRTDTRDILELPTAPRPEPGAVLRLRMGGVPVSATYERESATPSVDGPMWRLTFDSDPRLGLSDGRSIRVVISGFEVEEPPTEWSTVPVGVLFARRSEIF